MNFFPLLLPSFVFNQPSWTCFERISCSNLKSVKVLIQANKTTCANWSTMGQQEISKDFVDRIKRALSKKLTLDQRRAELPSSKFHLNQLLCQVTDSECRELTRWTCLPVIPCVLSCLIVNALRIFWFEDTACSEELMWMQCLFCFGAEIWILYLYEILPWFDNDKCLTG